MSGRDWPGACKELLLKRESVNLRAFTINLLSNSPRMNAPDFVARKFRSWEKSMRRKGLRTFVGRSLALVVVLGAAWKARKLKTPKHHIRTWPRLTNT